MLRGFKVLGWLLIVLGIPVAVIATRWRESAVTHPRLTAAAMLVWAAAGGTYAMLRRAAAQPVTERLEQFGTAANLAIGRRVSRYGRRWRQRTVTTLRLAEAKGLATVGPHTPELDKIFVELSLVARAPHLVRVGVLAATPAEAAAGPPPPNPDQRRSIHDFIDRPEPARLAILGVPGSGKTTLLRHVASHAARERRRRPFPVLLTLRDHPARLLADPPATLPELVRASLSGLDVAEPPGWWERQLYDGRCLVLLDGLDEVAVDTDRRRVGDWIEQQIAVYPGNDYVLTSRKHGYTTAPVPVAHILQVEPFTDPQVRQFLHGWYQVTERHAAGRDGDDVQARAAEGADDLLSRLTAAPKLYELTVNPLLLTMVANVHRYRGALPGGRADLYSEICQVMLWRRREAKRIELDPETEIAGPNKERILAQLAFTMMQRRLRDLSHEEIVAALMPNLRRLPQRVTADSFLADVTSNGLLVERERGQYAFAHHTFEEFLAARHIRETGQAKVLVDAVDEVWWRETILLYIADADADPIVRACLDRGTVPALTLAFDCLHGDIEIAPDLRERLAKVQSDAFADDADPDRRRVVAGVMATRLLDQFVVTAANSRICQRPVSTGLYWLFMQETGTPPPDGPVDLEADPERPVTGVWRTDAAEFLRWFDNLAGLAGRATRLPTGAEAQDLARRAVSTTAHQAAIRSGVWTAGRTNPGNLRVRSAEGESTALVVTETDLTAAVVRDVYKRPELFRNAVVAACSTVLAAILLVMRDPSGRTEPSPAELVLDVRSDRDPHGPLALARGSVPGVDRARELTQDLDRQLAHCLAAVDGFKYSAERLLPVPAGDALPHARELVVAIARVLAANTVHGVDLLEVLGCIRAAVNDLGLVPAMEPILDFILDLSVVRAVGRTDSGSAELAVSIGATLAFAYPMRPRPRIRSGGAVDDVFGASLAIALNDAAGFSNFATGIDLEVLATAAVSQAPATCLRDDTVMATLTGSLSAATHEVFRSRRQLTAATATTLRLTALALAAEARRANRRPDRLLALACGVTLLEQRIAGEVPLETIVVAHA